MATAERTIAAPDNPATAKQRAYIAGMVAKLTVQEAHELIEQLAPLTKDRGKAA